MNRWEKKKRMNRWDVPGSPVVKIWPSRNGTVLGLKKEPSTEPATSQRRLEDVTLGETSQTQTQVVCDSTLLRFPERSHRGRK